MPRLDALPKISTSSAGQQFAVRVAHDDSADLAAVQQLWRIHSDTLGFFPDGAFREHARRGWILVAKDQGGDLAGYLAYRTARSRAVVVHLCVDDAYRRQGVARSLAKEFRRRTADLLCARVTCRLDFDAAGLWDKLGFVRVGNRPAREPGRTLGLWEMRHGHPDLFSEIAEASTVAVMDANVFFDIVGDGGSGRPLQAKALQADWLQDWLCLAVTPELQNEISRNPNVTEQGRLRATAGRFLEVLATPDEVDEAYKQVVDILGPGISRSDRSDRRHLAHVIASKAEIFLSCDTDVLNHSEEIEARVGVRVLTPVALINDLDITQHPSAYSPARLEGSALQSRQLRSDEIDAVKQRFLYFDQAESASGLPLALRDALAAPDTCRARVITDGKDSLAGVIAVDRADPAQPRVASLRTKGPIAGTLARHLLWRTVNDAAVGEGQSVLFADRLVDASIREALVATGFVPDRSAWIKLIGKGVVTKSGLSAAVAGLLRTASVSEKLQVDLENAVKATEVGDAVAAVRLEHILWPLKIHDAAIPCYIVPIKPPFAAALFDTPMAAESLFAADPDLLLRLENVYYRSAKPKLRAPARVLWYTSSGTKGYSRSGHITAASTITAVTYGSPKDLFSRFRRFGVFTYENVTQLGSSAMAFTFAQTEVFMNAVSLRRIRALLSPHMSANQSFPSPLRIPEAAWMDLYREAGAPRA